MIRGSIVKDVPALEKKVRFFCPDLFDDHGINDAGISRNKTIAEFRKTRGQRSVLVDDVGIDLDAGTARVSILGEVRRVPESLREKITAGISWDEFTWVYLMGSGLRKPPQFRYLWKLMAARDLGTRLKLLGKIRVPEFEPMLKAFWDFAKSKPEKLRANLDMKTVLVRTQKLKELPAADHISTRLDMIQYIESFIDRIFRA